MAVISVWKTTPALVIHKEVGVPTAESGLENAQFFLRTNIVDQCHHFFK